MAYISVSVSLDDVAREIDASDFAELFNAFGRRHADAIDVLAKRLDIDDLDDDGRAFLKALRTICNEHFPEDGDG
jgi:hypothetical protein